ncbi:MULTISPECIES: 23S rRNA (guanosine(2251)-2'-O)-methyltransferase RlmB [Aphanothece]|uniref:23S rRNA (guanosine(2251)-2'-O)-methyltransferase RlmB n=1 Tax=Aphanothece TaxID=1121 RepID=UPI003984CC09
MSPRFERRPDRRMGNGGRGAARPGRDLGRDFGRDGGRPSPRDGRPDFSREGGRDPGRFRSRRPETEPGAWDAARPGAGRGSAARSQGERSGFVRRSPERPAPSGRGGAPREGAGRSLDPRDRPRFAGRRDQGSRPAARRFDGPRRPGATRPPLRPVVIDAERPAPAPVSEAERHSDEQPTDLVWGRHSAQAVLESGRPIHRIWCTTEMRFSPRFLQLLREAKASGVLVEEVTWARLGQLTGGGVHQGIVLQTAAAETLDLQGLIDGCRAVGEPPLLMALDGITDPHNLGAIARSAEALGAHGLVLPQRRSAGLTGSVAKVAAGALEHLPVARVVNLNRALDSLKQEGYRVVGLASEGSVSLEEADLEGPLVIVTGSEGDGLAMLTRKHCDQLVRIPLRGATPSLNASVATALLLYEVARRGWMKGLRGGQPAPRIQRPQLPAASAALTDLVQEQVNLASEAAVETGTAIASTIAATLDGVIETLTGAAASPQTAPETPDVGSAEALAEAAPADEVDEVDEVDEEPTGSTEWTESPESPHSPDSAVTESSELEPQPPSAQPEASREPEPEARSEGGSQIPSAASPEAPPTLHPGLPALTIPAEPEFHGDVQL